MYKHTHTHTHNSYEPECCNTMNERMHNILRYKETSHLFRMWYTFPANRSPSCKIISFTSASDSSVKPIIMVSLYMHTHMYASSEHNDSYRQYIDYKHTCMYTTTMYILFNLHVANKSLIYMYSIRADHCSFIRDTGNSFATMALKKIGGAPVKSPPSHTHTCTRLICLKPQVITQKSWRSECAPPSLYVWIPNLSPNNLPEVISESFNFKKFPGGACPQAPLVCWCASTLASYMYMASLNSQHLTMLLSLQTFLNETYLNGWYSPKVQLHVHTVILTNTMIVHDVMSRMLSFSPPVFTLSIGIGVVLSASANGIHTVCSY